MDTKDNTQVPELNPTELELRLREYELNLKERELDIKNALLSLKEREAGLVIKEKEAGLREKEGVIDKKGAFKEKLLTLSPVGATIIVGVIGVLGALSGNWYQGQKNIEIERQKHESSLILKALENSDKNERVKNLKLLLDLGLIKDVDSKRIEALIRNPEELPLTTSSGGGMSSRCPE